MLTVHEALVTAVAMQLRASRGAVEHALAAEEADMRPGTIFHSVRTSYQAGQQAIGRLLLDMRPNEKAEAALIELGVDLS